MLYQLMTVMNSTDGPISLDRLSKALGMEKSALKGMLDLLVRKGKLHYSDLGQIPQDGGCSGMACMSCGKASQCPFAGKMPRVYEKVRK
jgi:hypothetical protein